MRLICLLFLLPQLAFAQEPPPPEAAAPSGEETAVHGEVSGKAAPTTPAFGDATVHLVSSGGSGGIGSGTYRFSLPERVAAQLESQGGALKEVTAYHGALAQGEMLLVSHNRTVAGLISFLGDPETSCGLPNSGLALLTPQEQLVVPYESAPPEWATQVARTTTTSREIQLYPCINSYGVQATMIRPADSTTDPSWALEEWEFRLALHGTVASEGAEREIEFIGLPADEASRRVRLIEELRAEVPGTLFVDAGAFVDGTSSVRDGALSLHRPVGFSALKRLDPIALAPGVTELAGGAKAFLAEAAAAGLPYVATNWEAEDPALSLPNVLLRDVPTDAGVVQLAFLGVLDPQIHQWAPKIATDGVTLTDPVAAAQQAIDTQLAKPSPPHAIVVLTTAGPEVLRQLRRKLHGADVVLGDLRAEITRVDAIETTLSAADPLTTPPLTLPIDGIASTTIRFATVDERFVPTSVRIEPVPVPASLPTDADVLEAVGRTRSTEYPPLDHPLIPAPAEDPTATLDHGTWSKVVCESVLAYTGADVVLLPELPQGAPIPGALTELLVVDRLAMLDTLEQHSIPGDRMERLLFKSFGLVPVACGAPLGERWPKARGRFIEAERMYKVISTDRAREATDIGSLLQEAYSPWALDNPSFRPIEDDGRPITLRTAVLDTLRTLRDKGQGDLLADLTARSSSDKPPMWLVRIRSMAFSVERFQGADNAAFANIPETLATSPSSFTLGSDFDLALDYSSTKLLYDIRFRSTFTRLSTADEPAYETADDFRPSTSASLPGAAIPIPSVIDLMPYGEVFLDSEWTPIEGEDGEALPRQSELWFTLGLSAKRRGIIRALRIAGFGLRDLASPDKSMEYGARIEWETRVTFGPGLRWTTEADGSLFGNTSDQDVSDLRFRALLDTALALPLARYLDISLYGQGFLFQGRVDETKDLGAAWTLGFALDVNGAFEL